MYFFVVFNYCLDFDVVVIRSNMSQIERRKTQFRFIEKKNSTKFLIIIYDVNYAKFNFQNKY